MAAPGAGRGGGDGDAEERELREAIVTAIGKLGLEVVEKQIEKVIQLHEALRQRMGVAVVGPSGAGKTTLLRVLETALAALQRPVRLHVLNPKALERAQLLGQLDVDTREWSDGVLTRAARAVVNEPDSHAWIVCDGDIDPEWIEALNSVLDDNRLLTMPSGERIRFGSNVNFVFETHELAHASPATISRCGMIYLSEHDLDVRALVDAFVRREPDSQRRAALQVFADDVLMPAFSLVVGEDEEDDEDGAEEGSVRKPVVLTTPLGTVATALSQVEAEKASGMQELAAALVRGLGANLRLPARARLAAKVFAWSHIEVGSPEDALDLCYNDDGGGGDAGKDGIISALALAAPWTPPVVPTVQLARQLQLLRPWLAGQRLDPVIVVGPEGSGKSLLLEAALSELNAAVGVTTLNCSARTRARHLIQRLNEVCALANTASGRTLRPQTGERVVVLLRDLNLPHPDQYDTIELIALLQQLVTFGGYYDADDLEFVRLERVQILASMNPATTVGRHALSTRFTAVVHIAYIEYPARPDLVHVYTQLLKPVLSPRSAGAGGVSGGAIAEAMVDSYQAMRKHFSIDEHRHYLFTPRDLTAWVRALLRYDPNEELGDAIIHECKRIFRDRLVNSEARELFDRRVLAPLGAALRCGGSEGMIYTTLLSDGGVAEEDDEVREVLDVVGPRLIAVPAADFASEVDAMQRRYATSALLVHREMLEALSACERVLSSAGGSLLLVGPSGVGRREIVSVLAARMDVHVSTPAVGRAYDERAFFNELKEVLRLAGVEDKDVIVLIEEHQLVHAAMLETLNSVLAGGDVPGLFTAAETDAMIGPLREKCNADASFTGSPSAYLIHRIRRRVHVVLCMDSQHPSFAMRCQSNPTLYTRCCCVWRDAPTETVLRNTAANALRAPLSRVLGTQEDDDEADADADDKGERKNDERGDAVIEALLAVQRWCRKHMPTWCSPRKFEALLSAFGRVLEAQHVSISEKRRFLRLGLCKLGEAQTMVDTLSSEAAKQRVQLQAKQAEADAALEQITTSMARAGERRVEVEALQVALGKQEEELVGRKSEVEGELSQIAPMLAKAREAVGSIRKDALNEMRSLRMPPEAIHDVLAGVLVLMGNMDTSWNSMKKALASSTFKDEIIHFDASKITRATRDKVLSHLRSKKASFEHENIYRVNTAAAPLAAWVKAQLKYSVVIERISPLRQALAEANEALGAAKHRLETCVNELAELDAKTVELRSAFASTTGEAEALKAAVAKAETLLTRASHLLEQLAGERQRWQADDGVLDQDLQVLPQRAVLAAAFLTLLGAADDALRRRALADMANECLCVGVVQEEPEAEFSLCKVLSSESETLQWRSMGLHSDRVSLENAITIVQRVQTPFVIDPARQATRWLKAHLGPKAEVVATSAQRFTSALELALRFGKALVIEDVLGVEPVLFPALRHDPRSTGTRASVAVGDKMVDFGETFQMYLVTREANPQLEPSARALVVEVNFGVTKAGVRAQLLGETIAHQEPELEARKGALLRDEENLRVELAALERRLLEELATSEGSLLENTSLTASLDATKARSTAIAEKLEVSAEVAKELDARRQVYVPLAEAGAETFFLVEQLTHLNHMYRFSLAAFVAVFRANLDAQPAARADADDRNKRARIDAAVATLRVRLYEYVARSLFKDDRLTFAMHLARGLRPDLFTSGHEWPFLLGTSNSSSPSTTSALPSSTSAAATPTPDWLAADRHVAFRRLAGAFPELLQRAGLYEHAAQWSSWSRRPRPEVEMPPACSASSFQRLLLLQAMRPDRLLSALQAFVCDAIGLSNLALPPLQMRKLHDDETSPSAPVLFVSSPGADPTAALEELAATIVGRDNLVQIAMGEGQRDEAIAALRQASQKGQWLCLYNLHLVTAWLPVLDAALQQLKGAHENFRLWMTAEAHAAFSPALLERSLKLTVEAPPGLKRNLLSTYAMWTPNFVSMGRSSTRSQLLFVLAFLHSLLQERRVYVPHGFTKAYEFSSADLRAGADIVSALCGVAGDGKVVSTDTEISRGEWSTAHGLLELAVYGGRIDHDPDRRVLRVYLQRLFQGKNMGTTIQTLAPGVHAPASLSHDDYVKAVNAMPDVDAPAAFGLPDNIEGGVQQQTSARCLHALRRLRASARLQRGFERDVWAQALSPLLRLWQGQGNAPREQVGTASKGGGRRRFSSADERAMDPVPGFVLLEHHKAQHLVHVMDASLSEINALLYGSGLLTPQIQNDADYLLQDIVPPAWEKLWSGPESASAFVREVLMRKNALSEWLQRVERILSSPLNLVELFNGFILTSIGPKEQKYALLILSAIYVASTDEAGTA